jgi:hypothetical protein
MERVQAEVIIVRRRSSENIKDGMERKGFILPTQLTASIWQSKAFLFR